MRTWQNLPHHSFCACEAPDDEAHLDDYSNRDALTTDGSPNDSTRCSIRSSGSEQEKEARAVQTLFASFSRFLSGADGVDYCLSLGY